MASATITLILTFEKWIHSAIFFAFEGINILMFDTQHGKWWERRAVTLVCKLPLYGHGKDMGFNNQTASPKG